MAGNRDFDGEMTVFDRVRRLSALARFDPDAVDAATLAEVLSTVGGRYRRDVADAIERYAPEDPEGIAQHRSALLTEIDEYGGTAGEALARALGHAVAVDGWLVEALVERLADGRRPVAAAEGIAVAATIDPDAVADHLSALLAALADDPDVHDPLSRALAELYVTGAADEGGPIRPRIGRALEAEDDARRAGAIRVVCLAAEAGCQPAVDEVHRVIPSLSADDAGLFGADEDDLHGVVAACARSVAAGRPHALVPHLDTLLGAETRDDPAIEADLRASATAVVAASAPAFERLLEEVEPGEGWLSRMRSDPADDRRPRGVLARAAPDHVDVLVRREPAVRAILEDHPDTGAALVRAVAARDPGAVEWAIDPLLERIDGPSDAGDGTDEVADALGRLARTYPMIAGTVADRLATVEDDRREGAVLAARAIAEAAPGALAGTSGPGETPVAALLRASLTTQGQRVDAAYALTALGTHSPDLVAAIADDVADAVRTTTYEPVSERDRAVNALASVTAPAAPAAMHSLGLTVLDQVEGRTGELLTPNGDPNGLVALLGALAGEWSRYADRLVEWYREADGTEATGLLAAFAEAAHHHETAMAGHLETLVDATHRVDDGERASATAALAGAVAASEDPRSTATARLVDLVYDNSPAVRQAATFGVGEWLATAGTSHEEPRERLALVADADEGTPVAELALVRAGERPAEGAVDDLERVGLADLRGPAIAAVEELSGAIEDRERAIPEGNPALAALDRIRDEHPDPWVRAAADRALE